LRELKERRIALFLDFENLVTNTGISPGAFDLQPALDRLLEKGKVVFRRAYCDWNRFKEAKPSLHELGVELVDVPPSTRAGKNAADMRLVIDALELCYAREHIDTFVIASGDSDFCPLVYKLRENDRLVIGLAIREATSPFLVKACDEFIYLRPPSKEGKGARSSSPSVASSKTGAGKTQAPPRGQRGHRDGGEAHPVIPPLAVEVVSSLMAGATGPMNPSFLKEAMVRKEPDFDERDHGFSTFSKLLAAMEKEGLLRRQQHGRQWYVLPAEHGAEAPSSPGPLSNDEEPP
jgi:uncharacterized LabA/DUF88 family protein